MVRVGLTLVNGRSVLKKVTKKGTIVDRNSIQNIIKKQSPQNSEFDAKGVPKWSPDRCQNSSKLDAKTGKETIMKIIKNECFSEW